MGSNSRNKSSQTMGWLGFGFSAALLVLVWIGNILVISQLDQPYESVDRYTSLNGLLILIGIILGILALVFSILGLVSASKHGLKKLPGILGIALCGVSLISISTPFIYAGLIKPEPIKVILPPSVEETSEETSEDVDVILSLSNDGDVECCKADGSNIAYMNALNMSQFSSELKTWLQANGFNEDVSIAIKADKDLGFSDLANVLDALHDLGITQFSLRTENS